jgi:hypothetical protein
VEVAAAVAVHARRRRAEPEADVMDMFSRDQAL